MSPRQRESAIDAIYVVSGRHEEPPPRINLAPEVMHWAAADSGFAQAVKDLESSIGYAHESLYRSTESPAKLIDKLRDLSLFDDALSQALHQYQACDQLHDGAGVLIRAGQLLHARDSQSRSRVKVEQRIKDLTAAGFMGENQGAALWKNLGAYEWPSDFEIAVVSSPHVVFACNEGGWTAESYYPEHLRKLSGVIPELSPTEVNVERREADSAIVRGGYEVLVSFMNNGRRYSFRTYEGGIVRSGDRPRPCFMMFHALRTLNKALCDAHSNYRILKFEFGEGECGSYETTRMCLAFFDMTRCGIWWPEQVQKPGTSGLLAETQRDRRCEQLFATTYCRDSINSVFDELREAGLTSHLTEAQIYHARDLANSRYHKDWTSVFACVPDLLVHADSFSISAGPGSVTAQLDKLALVSNGRFAPADTKELWSGSPGRWTHIRLSFRFNGKLHRAHRRIRTNQMHNESPQLPMLANDLLKRADIDGRFCTMRFDRQPVYIYLTKAQYTILHSRYLSDYFGDMWGSPLSEGLSKKR